MFLESKNSVGVIKRSDPNKQFTIGQIIDLSMFAMGYLKFQWKLQICVPLHTILLSIILLLMTVNLIANHHYIITCDSYIFITCSLLYYVTNVALYKAVTYVCVCVDF